VFAVVPAFNEGGVIQGPLRTLSKHVDRVIVVDDGSSDDTAERAVAAGATVLRHVVNRGQGAALMTGIAFALRCGAHYVVTFDADGQHRATDIDRLLEPLRQGAAEIALGSRFIGSSQRVPVVRRAVLKAAVVFTRIVNRVLVTDAHNGLRAFTRRAALHLDLRLDRMAHASELLDQIRRSKLGYCEVAVTIDYTDYSLAKGQRSSAALRIVWDYVVARLLD
jgi:glycosyltransferase involved in cell wall biosynthesis